MVSNREAVGGLLLLAASQLLLVGTPFDDHSEDTCPVGSGFACQRL